MILIETKTLATTAASVVFSSIPQTYRDLVLMCYDSHDNAGMTNLMGHFNSDVTPTSNYEDGSMLWTNDNVSTPRYTTDAYGTNVPGFYISEASGTSMPSPAFSNTELKIYGYSDTSMYKHFTARGGFSSNSVASYEFFTHFVGGIWRSNAAISSITLRANVSASGGANNILAGSRFSLYGIGQA